MVLFSWVGSNLIFSYKRELRGFNVFSRGAGGGGGVEGGTAGIPWGLDNKKITFLRNLTTL